MRTAHPPAPLTAKIAQIVVAVFFLAMIVAITPNVLDTLARFGLIHGTKLALLVPTPQIVIRDAVPAFVPPVASPEPPQAPLRANSAPALAPPVSALTVAPVAPVGIKIIVVKPADGSGPIVLRDGYKYRGRP